MTTSADGLATALRHHLAVLYGPAETASTLPRLLALAESHRRPRGLRPLDQRDVWLIAYADHVSDGTRPPLQVLADLLDGPLSRVVSGVHVLPFHPWTSDDGFAVLDPRAVDPAVGTWADVESLARRRRVMADVVANHVSAASPHVTRWDGHCLEVEATFDTSQVVRPRTSELRTAVTAEDGVTRQAWTTFSPDQVDLDYRNPDVLVDVTDVLLGLLDRGVGAIRLDAIGFIWKASGTSCLNLPQAHEVVRLWRTMVDWCAPGALLVTETNVPHEENIAYLGDGTDEAHLVYQFTLPPLLLAAFTWGNAQDLVRWAASLAPPPEGTTVLNFLASHDGIGLRPAEARMSRAQVEGLCALATRAGGGVSMRAGPDGDAVPYELNTTVIDAMEAIADDGLGLARVLAAHAVVLAMQGVPALWLGTLLGGRNWTAGVEATGRLRTVNRQRFDLASATRALQGQGYAAALFEGLAELVALRTSSPAFAPSSPQRLVPGPPWLFAVERGEGAGRQVVLVSTSGRDRQVVPSALLGEGWWHDRLAGETSRPCAPGDALVLPPYGVAWLAVSGRR